MSAVRDIMAHPSLGFYYAQKAVRPAPLRNALGAAVAGIVGTRKVEGAANFTASIASRLAADLRDTGYAAMPEKALDAGTVDAVRAQLAQHPLYDYYGSGKSYDLVTIPANVVKVRHDSANVARCKPLMDLANDPDVLAAVTRRLGATPTIASAEAWWTFGEHNASAHIAPDDIYHRDLDDLRFVKMFLYLTDTGLKNGAHRFVLGSHADNHFTRRGPIADEEVERTYPADSLLTLAGSAGTVFLEETFGIHRALLATEGRRLMFSVIYVLAAKMPFGLHKPALPLPAGYDRYVNRRIYY